MHAKPKVGIVYLPFYHNDDFSSRAFSSIASQDYPKEALHTYVVNNPHWELGSYVPRLQELAQQTPGIPAVTFMATGKNLGFSGGNNVGIKRALEDACDYVMILNDDAFLARDCLSQLVGAMEADPTIAEAQPVIALYPDTQLVNSAGNALHLLGFGYSLGYKQPVTEWLNRGVRDVAYVSGAIAIFRADLLRVHGLMEEAFFMYHEDTELSLRYALRGYRTACVSDALGFHAYHFLRNKKALEWMERSRYTILLLTYKLPTLILLLPALIGTEIALWFFALKGGWIREKWRASTAWLRPQTWRTWLPKRAEHQRKRTVTDGVLLKRLTGQIDFQEQAQQHWLVRRLANPVLSAYLKALQLVVWW
jgi:GT2 family glycosyltransferase